MRILALLKKILTSHYKIIVLSISDYLTTRAFFFIQRINLQKFILAWEYLVWYKCN